MMFFIFIYLCICLLSTKIKAVKSFAPLKVWNFAAYGHVHVLFSMVCYISETKKTRANVVCVCIFYTFFCFRVFNLFFFLLRFKCQRYSCILSLITQTELCVCLIRIIYIFMHQIRVVNYNLETMSLIHPV